MINLLQIVQRKQNMVGDRNHFRTPEPTSYNRDRRTETEECEITHSEQIIRESEAAKARMYKTTGNEFTNPLVLESTEASAIVDEGYMMVGVHLDKNLQLKIINSKYVDFSRLVSRDRISREDDHSMELISKGGSTYFVPVTDREVTNISNFNKWEQAFRVFMNVFTRAHPEKSSQLIQYNHVIYSFSWENVYAYDKEFRMHISYHPHRRWAVILQQAWTMCMKDRIVGHRSDDRNFSKGKKEPCRRFNKGLCKKGLSCQYDHRCTVPNCGKFGHGAHIL